MRPLIIGHRGAPGHTPEHTLHSYELAVKFGADIFEPDLVITKDGVLIARHENEISETTNVSKIFPNRKRTKTIDGKSINGYFTEDFTLSEIKMLRAIERLPFRSQQENGLYPVATFEEILQLREELSKVYGRSIGIAPELKHSTYFKSQGLPLEAGFISLIKKYKLDGPGAPILVQSFEISNLKMLHKKLPNIQLVQLLDEENLYPFDQATHLKKISYGEMATAKGLKEISNYAGWVSPWKPYIIPFDSETKKLLKPTDFIKNSHAVGLKVVPYTFRNEDQYLSLDDKGNPEGEYLRFFKLNVDAVFSDYPDTAFSAREKFLNNKL